MSKRAEAAALKAYPNVEQPVWDESYPKTLFVRHTERNAFIKGYEQAEKDLALTWKDLALLEEIEKDIWEERMFDMTNMPSEEDMYNEVLKRFNKYKEDKK